MQRVDLATGTDDLQVQHTHTETMERVEPSNMESAKKLIAKYQQRIRELMKSIHQQKKANDQLKEELKKLNDTLNSLVTKITVKSKVEKEDPPREQITRRQLQNEMKKTASLRKQLQGLRARMKVYDSQKMGEMQDEINQKDKIIESMLQNIKLHEKLQKKDMNLDIYKKEEEAQQKIKALSEEIVHLKKKTQEQKKAQLQQDKSMKFQQLQLIALEDKKISPTKINTTNIQPPIAQQQHLKLQQLFKSSENSRKSLQKSSRIEGELLRSKLRQAEKTIEELKQQLARKQKQISLANLRLKMLEKGSTELAQSKPDEFGGWTSPRQDCRRELKGLMNIRSANRRFDDSTSLPLENDFRMSKLTFSYFEEHIVQLKVQYQILGSERSEHSMQTVTSFSIDSHYNSTKEAVLTLSDYEYIKEWEIYCGKCIEFMKIRTSKQQVLEVGNERNSLKCKRYAFEIKSYEKPVAVFGVMQLKNVADKEIEVLINLGLVLKRKNIFGKRAKSLAKLQSKTPSLLFNRPNDKNMLQ